jgi:RNA polymerase sigma-70 factor (ECF subfamily)
MRERRGEIGDHDADRSPGGQNISAASLVARVQAGDAQAEEEIFHRYRRGVLTVLRRNGATPDAAEDLYQEVLIIVLRKIREGTVHDPERLAGFVCGVARNCALAHRRTESRMPVVSDLDIEIFAAAEGQHELLSRREEAKLVRRVLGELRHGRDRELLVRFFLQGEDREAVCRGMGLTAAHFSRVLHRALKRFRELYEKTVRSGERRKR